MSDRTRTWKPRSDAEIEAQVEDARRRARESFGGRPSAADAWYDAEGDLVWVELTNGCLFAFPPRLGQGLSDASPEALAEVEPSPSGEGLHWESLDADLQVPELLMGIFGSRRWMAELGRAGGRVKSKRKAAAARRNGLKGGRPPKGKTG